LRVAILNPAYWPEVRRGAERILRELANGLIEHEHEPRLITSHPGWPSRSVEDGMLVIRNWRPPDGRLRRRYYEDHLTHVPFSYWSLCRGHDDIAQAFHAPEAVAAAHWARRTGRVSIHSHMGLPERRHLVARRRRVQLLVRAARECDAVTALSQTAAAAFQRELGIEARTIYPGVDLDTFSPGPGRAEQPTVICAAPFEVPQKRVRLLVEALPILRRSHPDLRLELLRPADRSIADELLALGIVLIEPVQEPLELVPAYRHAWVSALPSVGESFGMVLAESLACGTPVVGTNAHAIPEVIDRQEIGRLFDGEDPNALARALLETIELSRDPDTAEACRARAQAFSRERFVGSYLALYEELRARRE
jgi:glycosyltransferase involved in cell wall biosynthesis